MIGDIVGGADEIIERENQRAVARLESYKPAWPLPKVFRLTSGGKINEGIFVGETINTPSMLCVEDYLDALNWAKSLGGLKALYARADANAKAIADWVARTPWIDFLARKPDTRSNTSVCLKVVDPSVADEDEAGPLFPEASHYGDERRQKSGGWLSIFGRPRHDTAPAPTMRATGSAQPAQQPIAQQHAEDPDDLEIPSFLRRLAN